MALSPFNTVELLFSKAKYLSDRELKDYSQWMINIILSNDPMYCFLAQELNKEMSNRMHFDCLFYGLPKKTPRCKCKSESYKLVEQDGDLIHICSKCGKKIYVYFIQFNSKKFNVENEIKFISDFYNVNEFDAMQMANIISEEELKRISQFYERKDGK